MKMTISAASVPKGSIDTSPRQTRSCIIGPPAQHSIGFVSFDIMESDSRTGPKTSEPEPRTGKKN